MAGQAGVGEGWVRPPRPAVLGGCQRDPAGPGATRRASQGSSALALLPPAPPALAPDSWHPLRYHRCVCVFVCVLV